MNLLGRSFWMSGTLIAACCAAGSFCCRAAAEQMSDAGWPTPSLPPAYGQFVSESAVSPMPPVAVANEAAPMQGAVASQSLSPLPPSLSKFATPPTGQPYEYVADLADLARRSDYLMVACRGGPATHPCLYNEVVVRSQAKHPLYTALLHEELGKPDIRTTANDAKGRSVELPPNTVLVECPLKTPGVPETKSL